MGLFKLFKKKKVPETLPDLPLDSSTREILKKFDNSKTLEPKIDSILEESLELKRPAKELPTQKEEIRKEITKRRTEHKSSSEDEGFFKDVIKNAIEETEDLEKLNSWYKKKFEPQDIVHQLRDYWENQKPEILLKKVGKDVKEKILAKTEMLDQLEKDWQEIYFQLLEKENEIRSQEKEIKSLLSELIQVYQNSVKKTEKK